LSNLAMPTEAAVTQAGHTMHSFPIYCQNFQILCLFYCGCHTQTHTNTTHRAPLLYIQQHCLCGVQTVNRYTLSLSKSSGNRNVEVDNNIYIIVVFLIIIGVISLGTEAPVMSCNN